MKKSLILMTIMAITLNSFAESTCRIMEEYAKIFAVKKTTYGEREFLMRYVQEVEPTNCFAELINQNQDYIGYLQTNFSDKLNTKRLLEITDTIQLHEAFILDLQGDTLFNRVMLRFAEKFENKAAYIPDTITMDQLLNIGSKFFSIVDITEEGYYAGKVCSGINDIKKTEAERKPHIEGFCFSAVYGNYEGEKFNTYNELVSGLKELYKLNLGIDEDERLLRAQGALYMFMRNNSNLRDILQYEYDQRKTYLPFVLRISD